MKLLSVFVCVLSCLSPQSQAMQFHQIGSVLVLAGPVEAGDGTRFSEMLAQGGVQLVLLHQSPGGDLQAGLQIGQRIRELGLATAVSGHCASACALMFLGGVSRQFSDGTQLAKTRLGFHGPHKHHTKVVSGGASAERVGRYIEQMSGGRYGGELLDRTIRIANYRDMVYMYHPEVKLAERTARGVVECLNMGPEPARCRSLPGHDVLSAGVVTSLEVLHLSAYPGAAAQGRQKAQEGDEAGVPTEGTPETAATPRPLGTAQ